MDLAVLGITIGIIGIAASYFFYRKAIRAKKPTWASRSFNLITDFAPELPGIRVLFRETPVVNLTVTKVMFWNDGRETIDRSDIVAANPLRVVASDGVRILSAEVVKLNRPSTRVAVDLAHDGRTALITFDYLDHDNGAVVRLIHDGAGPDDVRLQGDLKGVEVIPQKAPPSSRRSHAFRRASRLVRAVQLALSALYLALATFLLFNRWGDTQSLSSVDRAGLTGGVVIMVVVMAISLLASRRQSITPPPGLEEFHEWP